MELEPCIEHRERRLHWVDGEPKKEKLDQKIMLRLNSCRKMPLALSPASAKEEDYTRSIQRFCQLQCFAHYWLSIPGLKLYTLVAVF
jgi:hypothetical protein